MRDRSISKPSSLVELSAQLRLICVEDTAIAVKDPGALGGSGFEAPVEYVA